MQATVAVGTTLSREYNMRICFVKVQPQFAVREMQWVNVKVVDAIAPASYNGVQRGATMGKTKEPRPVKLIASAFSADTTLALTRSFSSFRPSRSAGTAAG